MAKNCMMRRERRREKLSAAGTAKSEKRQKLKKIINDPNASLEEKENAQKQIQLMKRDSSPSRRRNRCYITGRARGVYSMVGICRNMFRIMAMNGEIPGITKASW